VSRVRILVAAVALGTFGSLAACDRSPTAPVARTAPTAIDALRPTSLSALRLQAPTQSFNPQPDPPRVARFDAVLFGVKSGGTFGVGARQGAIEIQTVSTERAGQVLHVVQAWSFLPPPCLPPDPCRSPVRARLEGTVNLRGGLVDLNGVASDGTGVHVRGTIQGGPDSVAGEVMFNPQPDPPRTLGG
jgi:hypothetical protein